MVSTIRSPTARGGVWSEIGELVQLQGHDLKILVSGKVLEATASVLAVGTPKFHLRFPKSEAGLLKNESNSPYDQVRNIFYTPFMRVSGKDFASSI